MENQYYVYIMTNRSGTLYIGVTNDLIRRVHEHRMKLVDGFTRTYHLTQLVYYEAGPDIREAIAREKVLKGWSRAKKHALIKTMNPQWNDLAAEFFGTARTEIPRAAPSE
jgi:putative endonuclease